MMRTEQISETQVFSPHVARLIAREQFSERVHRESFKSCLCALLGCLWPLHVTVNCFKWWVGEDELLGVFSLMILFYFGNWPYGYCASTLISKEFNW